MSIPRINPANAATWALVAVFLINPLLTKFPDEILTWDAFGYYLYLPQAFIYGDLQMQDLTQVNQIVADYGISPGLYQVHMAENGNHVIQYTMGQAIMNLPFFFIGHLCAILFGYPADGFSSPYVWSLIFGSYFYMIVGLIYLRKCLVKFFTPGVSAITILLIGLGTNYFVTHTSSHGMPHVFLFTLYCLFVWNCIRWHESPSKKRSIILGSILGLMIIYRPTEIIAVIIPLLYGISDKESLKLKIAFLIQNKTSLFISLAAAILIVSPQLIYWKYAAGEYLYNSYRNPGEGLELLYPHTVDFLFSFRKGWFIYTPMIFFAVYGFFVMKKDVKNRWFIPLLCFVIINVYVSSCWSNWWYAGAFSQRTMVQSYVIIAILLAAFIDRNKNGWRRSIFILPVFFVALNLFQSWQYFRRIVDGTRMTAAYYFEIFGRTTVPQGAEKLLLIDRENPKFDSENYLKSQPIFIGEPNREYTFTEEYSTAFMKSYDEVVTDDHAWIETQVEVKLTNVDHPENILLVHSFVHNEAPYANEYSVPKPDSSEVWISLYDLYLTPEPRITKDELRIFLWNRGEKVVYRNFKISIFNQK